MNSKKSKKGILIPLLGIPLIICLLFLGFIIYASSPALSPAQMKPLGILQFNPKEAAPQEAQPSTIKVVTYNMGYGSGEKNNLGHVLNPSEVKQNIQQMTEALKTIDPDLILLQEVDFFSKRSFDTNQFEELAAALNMPYGAYAINWNKKYIAWPYWPLHSQFGRIVSGQAVLSRYPIIKQNLIRFPKPKNNPFWYNWFYIDRLVQVLNIKIGKELWSVYNAHLEAFDTETRYEQIKNFILDIQKNPNPNKIVGGDFNQMWHGLDYPEAKLKNSKEVIKIFSRKTGLILVSMEKRILTFPSWKPRKGIDHIFYSPNLQIHETGVFAPLPASDHLPVWADFSLPNP